MENSFKAELAHRRGINESIFRAVSVLVSTDVAAMGLDVMDLNISVNIGLIKIIADKFLTKLISGLPKSCWKIKQQQGRVGRNGSNALDITLVFPQKGKASAN